MNESTKILLELAKIIPIGAVIGWALSYWQTRRRERKFESNVRILLGIEIDENTAALRDYDLLLQQKVESDVLHQVKHHQLRVRADSLRTTPLPEWKHQAFDELFSSLPNALNEESIREISDFHRRLEKLGELHTKTRTQHPLFKPEETVKRATKTYGEMMGEDTSSIILNPDGWEPFENEVSSLLALGDKLQQQLQPTKRKLTTPLRKPLK